MPRKPRETWRSEIRSSPEVQRAFKRLGERLRDLRKERGLTQEQLGERARLDAKHVAIIENGKTNPTVASLVGLARALKVPMKELFEGV